MEFRTSSKVINDDVTLYDDDAVVVYSHCEICLYGLLVIYIVVPE